MRTFIGVIGGLGTDATIRFFQALNDFDFGKGDEERRKMLLYNNPDIPSRSIDFHEGDRDVKEALIASVKVLDDAGVDVIAIPCNTVHYFHRSLQENAEAEILNIIDITRRACLDVMGPSARIGILGSQKTIQTGLYQESFQEENVEVDTPPETMQPLIDDAIDHVKRNDMRDFSHFAKAVESFTEQKSLDALILGCTELGLIPLEYYPLHTRLFDSNTSLAEAVYRYAEANNCNE